MYYIVDRIEEDYVVLEDEDKGTVNIPKKKFEFEVMEGDVVMFDEFGHIVIDEDRTDDRKRKIKEKIIDLWL